MESMKKMGALLLIATLGFSCVSQAEVSDLARENVLEVLYDFEDGVIPEHFEITDVDATIIDFNGSKALQIDFHKVQNPNIKIHWDLAMDLTGKTIAFDLSNPGDRATESWIQLRSTGGDGQKASSSYDCDIAPGKTMTWYIAVEWLKFDQDLRDQGHGVQYSQWGNDLVLSDIKRFSFWQWEPVRASTVIVDNIRLVDFILPEQQ